MSEVVDRFELIKQIAENKKTKEEGMPMGGKRVKLTDADVDIIKDMIKSRHGKPGYNDAEIAKKASN